MERMEVLNQRAQQLAMQQAQEERDRQDQLTKEEIEQKLKEDREKEQRREWLSKKLSYVLRYAAKKEGLKPDDSGEIFFSSNKEKTKI